MGCLSNLKRKIYKFSNDVIRRVCYNYMDDPFMRQVSFEGLPGYTVSLGVKHLEIT